MNKIIKGTTPTIKYTFNTVDVSTIVAAYMTIKQDGIVVIEKTLSDATVGENEIYWTIPQSDSLRLKIGNASMMINWKTSDGTRGASAEDTVSIIQNHKNEVI